MSTTIASRTIPYWTAIKRLDNETKIQLIHMLSESMMESVQRHRTSVSEFYGAFNNDGIDCEDWIADIRSERRFNKEITYLSL